MSLLCAPCYINACYLVR
uniref:Uncharacterized protein n=1 Tax=Arundo donax TaxID=35708 RepID=A0A0A9GV00_ARUDO